MCVCSVRSRDFCGVKQFGWVAVSGVQLSVRENLSHYAYITMPPRSTQPGHPSVGRRNEYMASATAREENGEFCVTTAGILT